MPTATCTGMTPTAIEEMIERRVEEALEACLNRKPTRENGYGNRDGGGNSNRNELGGRDRNGNPNVNVTVGTEATYAMTWKALMKLMTEVAYETSGCCLNCQQLDVPKAKGLFSLLGTVRIRDMLGYYPTATSANSTMRGSV
ncbi:hypothetical protein Tco_0502725 [Tanacetum coccineum]